jgi:hypothetical protein
MGTPIFTEVTPFEAAFIKHAEACGLLAEVCMFVDYYQDKGCVKEHFRANPKILAFAKNLTQEQAYAQQQRQQMPDAPF